MDDSRKNANCSIVLKANYRIECLNGELNKEKGIDEEAQLNGNDNQVLIAQDAFHHDNSE
jgi:hypothetical protein